MRRKILIISMVTIPVWGWLAIGLIKRVASHQQSGLVQSNGGFIALAPIEYVPIRTPNGTCRNIGEIQVIGSDVFECMPVWRKK